MTVSQEDDKTIRFAPEIPHRRLSMAAWDEIYIVGDVHGCRAELDRLLETLAVTEDDLVIFVGDLVRKGPESQGVIDRVRSQPNLLSVRGNNEQKVLAGTADPGLDETAVSYLETLPLAISLGQHLVVHGGIEIRKSLPAQTQADLLEHRWMPAPDGDGEDYWFEHHNEPPRVFFGHTVLDRPYVSDWAVGLDTGCVHGRELSAYDLRADMVRSITAEMTYEPRAADSIVTTSTLSQPTDV